MIIIDCLVLNCHHQIIHTCWHTHVHSLAKGRQTKHVHTGGHTYKHGALTAPNIVKRLHTRNIRIYIYVYVYCSGDHWRCWNQFHCVRLSSSLKNHLNRVSCSYLDEGKMCHNRQQMKLQRCSGVQILFFRNTGICFFGKSPNQKSHHYHF